MRKRCSEAPIHVAILLESNCRSHTWRTAQNPYAFPTEEIMMEIASAQSLPYNGEVCQIDTSLLKADPYFP